MPTTARSTSSRIRVACSWTWASSIRALPVQRRRAAARRCRHRRRSARATARDRRGRSPRRRRRARGARRPGFASRSIPRRAARSSVAIRRRRRPQPVVEVEGGREAERDLALHALELGDPLSRDARAFAAQRRTRDGPRGGSALRRAASRWPSPIAASTRTYTCTASPARPGSARSTIASTSGEEEREAGRSRGRAASTPSSRAALRSPPCAPARRARAPRADRREPSPAPRSLPPSSPRPPHAART